MSYNISVVNIVSDTYKDTINAVAASYGVGNNSLSVKLIDSTGSIYWGCHTRERMFDLPHPPDIPNSAEALAALYERVVLDGVPMDNWNAALAELGLSVVEETL